MSEDIVVAKVRKIEVGTLWDWGKVLGRHLTTIMAILGILWMFAGPTVEGYAADAFVDMLKKQGVDPKVFKKVQDQTEQITKDLDQVSKDAANIKEQLDDLQTSNEKLSQEFQNTNRSIEKVEDLVNKLLTIQLQRADMTFSPPGAGPSGLPQLGSASP